MNFLAFSFLSHWDGDVSVDYFPIFRQKIGYGYKLAWPGKVFIATKIKKIYYHHKVP